MVVSLININERFDAKAHSLERMGDSIGEERTWFSLEVFRAFLSHVDDQMMLDNHFRVYLILALIHQNPPRNKRVVFQSMVGLLLLNNG